MTLIKFIVVGIFANIVNFCFYFLLFNLSSAVHLSSIVGYIAGLIVSFYFSKTWVFLDRRNSNLRTYGSFFLVYAFGGLGMTFLIDYFSNHYLLDFKISWIIGALYAVINNFFGLKFMVFKKRN